MFENINIKDYSETSEKILTIPNIGNFRLLQVSLNGTEIIITNNKNLYNYLPENNK